jgi:hypothetical protein
MPMDYQVNSGDCISSVAFNHGFFWETLWNHGDNSELKSKRKDPNILKEGDVVHIPDLTLKEESCATENRHRFKLKGVPAKLKLRLMRPKPEKDEDESKPAGSGSSAAGLGASLPGPLGGGGGGGEGNSDLSDPDYKPPKEEEEPISNAPYIFEVDGSLVDEGKTDGDGGVEIPLPPNAKEGRITVHPGKPEEKTFALQLGGVDPVDEVSGVRQRLANLGFFCAPEGPADAEDLQTSLRKFQEKNSLDVTGKIDDATKSKLKDLHGC